MTKNRNQDQTVLENDLLEFINKRFLDRILINGKKPSIREIERETNIGRSTVNKILKKDSYDLPISTINKICTYANISLKQFFTEFEEYLKEKNRN